MTNRPGNRRGLETGNDVRILMICGAAMAMAACVGLSACKDGVQPSQARASTPDGETFILPPGSAKLPLSGPAAYCRQPDVIRKMLKTFSTTSALTTAGETAVDFTEATTTAIDDKAMTFSCHGTFRLSNGQEVPGTFSLTKNAAGDPKWMWMNDPNKDDEDARAQKAAAMAEQIADEEPKTDPDTFAFDPRADIQRHEFEAMKDSAENCISKGVETQIYGGNRSRSRIKRMLQGCTSALVSSKNMNIEGATAFVSDVVDHNIDYYLSERQ